MRIPKPNYQADKVLAKFKFQELVALDKIDDGGFTASISYGNTPSKTRQIDGIQYILAPGTEIYQRSYQRGRIHGTKIRCTFTRDAQTQSSDQVARPCVVGIYRGQAGEASFSLPPMVLDFPPAEWPHCVTKWMTQPSGSSTKCTISMYDTTANVYGQTATIKAGEDEFFTATPQTLENNDVKWNFFPFCYFPPFADGQGNQTCKVSCIIDTVQYYEFFDRQDDRVATLPPYVPA